MPGVSATACWSAVSCASVSGAFFGVSTASRNGPLVPGPNASLNWSYATRWVADSGWLPSSGWPMRSPVTGNANTSRTATPAAIDAHGRRVTNSPQRVNAGETWACSAFFGTSRRPKAPIMIGRIVSAATTTAPTASAEPRPIFPMNGTPTTSRPASATITISPAATTVVPDVAAARAAASCRLSPAARCSR